MQFFRIKRNFVLVMNKGSLIRGKLQWHDSVMIRTDKVSYKTLYKVNKAHISDVSLSIGELSHGRLQLLIVATVCLLSTCINKQQIAPSWVKLLINFCILMRRKNNVVNNKSIDIVSIKMWCFTLEKRKKTCYMNSLYRVSCVSNIYL